ncbi:hypothetical protein [Pseudacidovorax intermedius]|uniref:Tryptophan synthase subunit beta like protein n=1 Tax=Pseudacidovorax intermedius TaxID=433924 RepID=A0A147GPE9_9BURK|nr:hypothetical protein [Pseudacidovorax intermedius]KTT16401.1 hypothetical protein NS331_18525 [Pseudacidovorax intermedius]
MPFVQRNAQGELIALFAEAQPQASEWLDAEAREVHNFVGGSGAVAGQGRGFGDLDSDFIRVLEDVIDALIDKNLLRLTDLPLEAQRKLLARKDLRQHLRSRLDLLPGDEVI